MEEFQYYIVREKDSHITAKGTLGMGRGSSVRNSKSPPKLYNIGPAKGLVTSREKHKVYMKKYHNVDVNDLEIVPVILTIQESSE